MPGLESIEQNLVELFRHSARSRESGEIREMPGVSIASSGVAFHMFNAAFLSKQVRSTANELERRIAIAAVHFAARGLRWAYWVCDDKLERKVRRRSEEVFHRNGLELASELPGMTAGRLLPPIRPLPSLEIRRVEDKQRRLEFCDILSVVFSLPFPWALETYDLENIWGGDLEGYVGYVDGAPVTTAAVMQAAGVAGVYCVATLPDHRGQGYAEAIVRHALERARDAWGVESSILQSSTAAVPLYRRMGYETVTRFTVYGSA